MPFGYSQARVLVVGDLTLDEFITGQVKRISREAPVLILRHEITLQVPGGGEYRMSLFDPAGNEQHIPAFNRTQVFDVTGAGDTVVAALTLGLVAGASFWEVTVLGNLAASIVVRHFGTTTTTASQMKAALQVLLEG